MEYREITRESNLPDDFIMPESLDWFNGSYWFFTGFRGKTFSHWKINKTDTRYRILASDWPKEFKGKNGKDLKDLKELHNAIGATETTKPRKPHKMKKATRKVNWNYITEDSPLEELPEFGTEVQVLTDDNSDNGECYVMLAEFVRRVQDKNGTSLEWCGPQNVIAWFPSAALPDIHYSTNVLDEKVE